MTASARDLDLRQHHGIETPEHVDVQFELAGVGSRLAAGGPITPAAAVVRNLVRFVDCYFPIPFAPALLSMFLHPSNKRPGDMAAGTIVVRDHPTDWSLGAPVLAVTDAEPIETGPPELSE